LDANLRSSLSLSEMRALRFEPDCSVVHHWSVELASWIPPLPRAAPVGALWAP